MSWEEIDREFKQTKLRLEELDKKKKTIEQSAEFKDNKIKELEKRILSLENELSPYRKAVEQKRIDDYGNMKCTAIGCYCRICRDL